MKVPQIWIYFYFTGKTELRLRGHFALTFITKRQVPAFARPVIQLYRMNVRKPHNFLRYASSSPSAYAYNIKVQRSGAICSFPYICRISVIMD